MAPDMLSARYSVGRVSIFEHFRIESTIVTKSQEKQFNTKKYLVVLPCIAKTRRMRSLKFVYQKGAIFCNCSPTTLVK